MTPWNHNTHHAPRVRQLLPPSRGSVLEIGPGDGRFAGELARSFDAVVAVEPDPVQAEAARSRCTGLSNVRVVEDGFLTADVPAGVFDAVVALASFHHVPWADAVQRVRAVLKPGGRLVVLGVWTDSGTRDVVWNARSVVLNTRLRRRLGPDTMTAPATFEQTSWWETRTWCRRDLPGAELTRLPLWRYTLVWDKPT